MTTTIKKSTNKAPKVLFKSINLDLDKVLELVKTDRFKARVLIKNDPSKYTYTEIIVFEDKNQITVIDQTKKLNISINNKLYYTIQNKQIFSISFTISRLPSLICRSIAILFNVCS